MQIVSSLTADACWKGHFVHTDQTFVFMSDEEDWFGTQWRAPEATWWDPAELEDHP